MRAYLYFMDQEKWSFHLLAEDYKIRYSHHGLESMKNAMEAAAAPKIPTIAAYPPGKPPEMAIATETEIQ